MGTVDFAHAVQEQTDHRGPFARDCSLSIGGRAWEGPAPDRPLRGFPLKFLIAAKIDQNNHFRKTWVRPAPTNSASATGLNTEHCHLKGTSKSAVAVRVSLDNLVEQEFCGYCLSRVNGRPSVLSRISLGFRHHVPSWRGHVSLSMGGPLYSTAVPNLR